MIEGGTRDIDSLDISNMCYAVQFYDQDEDVIEVFDKQKLVKDDPRNFPLCIISEEELLLKKDARIEGHSVLVNNMKRNEWKQVVMTRHDQVFPAYEDQKVEILPPRK